MTERPRTEEVWLTPIQVCDLFPAWNPAYLAQLRFKGNGPVYAKPSPRKVLYRLSAIEEFLRNSERESTRDIR